MGIENKSPEKEKSPAAVAFENAIQKVTGRDAQQREANKGATDQHGQPIDTNVGKAKLTAYLETLHKEADRLRKDRGAGSRLRYNSVRDALRNDYPQLENEITELEKASEKFVEEG